MSPRVLALAALLVGGCALLDFDPASRPYQDAGAHVDVTVSDVVSAQDVIPPSDVVSAQDVIPPSDVETAVDAGCAAGCPTGLSCVNGACGCPTGLMDCGGDRPTRCRQCCRNLDCDDRNGCTTDRCDNEGRCTNVGCAAGEVCCGNARCCQGTCSGGRCG